MKKIILTTILFGALTTAKSQVAIGKTTVTNTSVSLEFSDADKKGIILPYIEDKSAITENGSVIFDNADHKVKYLKNNSWFDLSVDTTGKSDISIQQSKTELTTSKAGVGTNSATDTVNGILVLTDADKAMILPRVASPHLNIINPASGMMVYDTTKKQLAVYNGTVWSFWKP